MAGYAELLYAVRHRVVLRYFGELCMALAVLTAVPMALSFFLGGAAAGFRLLGVGLVAGTSGFLLSRMRAPSDVQLNEALVTSVQDPNFEELCGHLGIEEAVVPSRMISRHLGDLVEGLDILELRTVIKGEARFFSFTARDEERGKVSELHLPEMAKVICLYREDEFILAEPDTRIHTDDEVVILTHSRHIPDLRERWNPKSTDA